MTQHTPEPVRDAANKLMGALALHEDTRDTVQSALHDMWDAGREDATATVTQLVALIRDDANAAINGATLPRAAVHRVRDKAEQILTTLNHTTTTAEGSAQR